MHDKEGSPLYPAEPAEQPLSAIHRDWLDYAEYTTNQNSPEQSRPILTHVQIRFNVTVKPHLTPRPEQYFIPLYDDIGQANIFLIG